MGENESNCNKAILKWKLRYQEKIQNNTKKYYKVESILSGSYIHWQMHENVASPEVLSDSNDLQVTVDQVAIRCIISIILY